MEVSHMTYNQYIKNLMVPDCRIDAVLDTDAYNEIDDQFAIGYMLAHSEKINTLGICAAPFFNSNSTSAADGMIKSYDEILKLLRLAGREDMFDRVYRGSASYLPDENTPVESEAADYMAKLANEYSPENPLYIVAIGAITNVASAILKNPDMKENCVVVWLGGHSTHMPFGASEFNMVQDIAAARIIMGCGVPFVQLPCYGTVDKFTVSKPELIYWLKGKNPLCEYLADNTIAAADSYAEGKPWTRPVWDVTAVAWLLNDGERFMMEKLIPSPIPEYDRTYSFDRERHMIRYVYSINRDALFEDLFNTLVNAYENI